MTKLKPYADVTDAEIDAAIVRGKIYEQFAPRAVAATYRAKDDVIVIRFASEIEVTLPRRRLQGLQNASASELAALEVLGGEMLHWESLDVDHYIPSLLQGVFGTRRWMAEIGRRGGSTRSEAKRAAARKNGRKGGRPRRVAT
ncbi:MAG: DUF2442 domain-containing protein [Vulcanimicrobiaceae bacterium]